MASVHGLIPGSELIAVVHVHAETYINDTEVDRAEERTSIQLRLYDANLKLIHWQYKIINVLGLWYSTEHNINDTEVTGLRNVP